MPLAYLNGRFVPAAELTLSFADAGFVSAATVTDFCRTYRGRLFRWADHLLRFRHDCEALRIPVAVSDADLTVAAERLVRDNAAGEELAVVTFATPGPLGYLLGELASGPPTLGMHTFPIPRERYRRFISEGITLAVAGSHVSGIVPAEVKHRSRLHWWLADRAVRDTHPGAVAVVLDDAGVADTPIGTVLGVVGGTVVAPPAGRVLAGVSGQVVRELCAAGGIPFAEAVVDFRRLPADVSEVMLAGSGFGVAGVRAVAGVREFAWPGPVFGRLLAAWAALVGVDPAAEFR
jgi:branched-chain amino acid aminotransferase